jgi:hypothetical protein
MLIPVKFKLQTQGPILHETKLDPMEVPRLRERVSLPGSAKRYEVRSISRRFTRGLRGLSGIEVELIEPAKVRTRKKDES